MQQQFSHIVNFLLIVLTNFFIKIYLSINLFFGFPLLVFALQEFTRSTLLWNVYQRNSLFVLISFLLSFFCLNIFHVRLFPYQLLQNWLLLFLLFIINGKMFLLINGLIAETLKKIAQFLIIHHSYGSIAIKRKMRRILDCILIQNALRSNSVKRTGWFLLFVLLLFCFSRHY